MAKPLLSVGKLTEKGWTIQFGPEKSMMKKGGTTIPLQKVNGVYKVAMDFHGQPRV